MAPKMRSSPTSVPLGGRCTVMCLDCSTFRIRTYQRTGNTSILNSAMAWLSTHKMQRGSLNDTKTCAANLTSANLTSSGVLDLIQRVATRYHLCHGNGSTLKFPPFPPDSSTDSCPYTARSISSKSCKISLSMNGKMPLMINPSFPSLGSTQ
jgi:hypothetical protein